MPNEQRLESLERRLQFCEQMIFKLVTIATSPQFQDERMQCMYCKQEFRFGEFGHHVEHCFRSQSQ